jgi:TatD DNase family protein
MLYVDVHTHLTDPRFDPDRAEVIARAEALGFAALIVNGLEPDSNREILRMAAAHPVVKPALGIYPIDAVNDRLPEGFPLDVRHFDVDAEIAFIRERALAGELIAIGECGLDGHWVGPETFPRQEAVFERLIEVAREADLPLIIHTRKLEERAASILKNQRVRKVDFHCFGGKTRLAQKLAEEEGWWFSIPANASVNEAFKKMLGTLPIERVLTETDAPYLSPVKGTRNEPANVVGTVKLFAALRGLDEAAAAARIYDNFTALFGN